MKSLRRYVKQLENRRYTLRYLPGFQEDLMECVRYISNNLQNPAAAEKLINDVEAAIFERLECPLAFKPYPSSRNRELDYYRINIRNYSVFYVVIDDIMEVRRFIYNRRDLTKIL